ncbi:hypothetical protein NBRC10513_006358 [Rhodotorula toruloides]
MDQQPTGACMVCGKETKNRCSKCAGAGIDLFFCSPEHQKLVWSMHRFFCGPGKANPFRFPPLSPDEVEAALEGLDMRVDPNNGAHATLRQMLSDSKPALGLDAEVWNVLPSRRHSPYLPHFHPQDVINLFSSYETMPAGLSMQQLHACRLHSARRRLREADQTPGTIYVEPPLATLTSLAIHALVADVDASWRTPLLHRFSILVALVSGPSSPQRFRCLDYAIRKTTEFIYFGTRPIQ